MRLSSSRSMSDQVVSSAQMYAIDWSGLRTQTISLWVVVRVLILEMLFYTVLCVQVRLAIAALQDSGVCVFYYILKINFNTYIGRETVSTIIKLNLYSFIQKYKSPTSKSFNIVYSAHFFRHSHKKMLLLSKSQYRTMEKNVTGANDSANKKEEVALGGTHCERLTLM